MPAPVARMQQEADSSQETAAEAINGDREVPTLQFIDENDQGGTDADLDPWEKDYCEHFVRGTVCAWDTFYTYLVYQKVTSLRPLCKANNSAGIVQAGNKRRLVCRLLLHFHRTLGADEGSWKRALSTDHSYIDWPQHPTQQSRAYFAAPTYHALMEFRPADEQTPTERVAAKR